MQQEPAEGSQRVRLQKVVAEVLLQPPPPLRVHREQIAQSVRIDLRLRGGEQFAGLGTIRVGTPPPKRGTEVASGHHRVFHPRPLGATQRIGTVGGQASLDAFQQIPQGDVRLHQEITHPQPGSLLQHVRTRVGGQEERGNLAQGVAGTQGLQEFHPGHPRQGHVQEEEIDAPSIQGFHRLARIASLEHHIAMVLQRFGQVLPKYDLILDQ